jgi:hypothetical protein
MEALLALLQFEVSVADNSAEIAVTLDWRRIAGCLDVVAAAFSGVSSTSSVPSRRCMGSIHSAQALVYLLRNCEHRLLTSLQEQRAAYACGTLITHHVKTLSDLEQFTAQMPAKCIQRLLALPNVDSLKEDICLQLSSTDVKIGDSLLRAVLGKQRLEFKVTVCLESFLRARFKLSAPLTAVLSFQATPRSAM